MFRAPTSIALLVFLCGCGDGFVSRPTTVSFDPSNKDFWALPFPSDLRKQDDGTYNIERYPGMRTTLSDMWIKVADKRLTDGWGVSPGVFFTTSGAIDAKTLPQTPTDSMGTGASAYLIDIDDSSPEKGRRFPLQVSFFADAEADQPANLVALIPVYGFVRRPHTVYAAVLTDAVKDSSGTPLGRTLAFHQAWTKDSKADANAVTNLAPLRTYFEKNKLDDKHVVVAAVFHTFDPTATLVKLSSWVETQPAPQVSGAWVPMDDYAAYQWFSNHYTVPKIQSGDVPGHGTIQWGSDGNPMVSGSQQVRLSLSIPKTPMPDGGYPVMLYFHGSGGEYRQVLDRGPLPQVAERDQLGEPDAGTGPAAYLAERGIAAMGFDFPLHGDRSNPPDTTGLALYDLFGDIDKTVDNMQVGAMEVVYLTRLIDQIQLPSNLSPNLHPGNATDGIVRLNVTRLSAMGQSMGTTFGIPIASVDPRIKGYVFSGAGGSLVDIANEALEPIEIRPSLELLLGFPSTDHLHQAHPMAHLFQHLWDLTDPQGKARYVAAEPHQGQQPKPFMMFAGERDGYFAPNAQSAVAVPLGGVLVGGSVETVVPGNLQLAGRTPVMGPLSNNLNGVTAGVVQYAAPFNLGHYVAFDEEDARNQYLCFVQHVGTPEGPSIIAAGGVCP